jgi:hypothetical protein
MPRGTIGRLSGSERAVPSWLTTPPDDWSPTDDRFEAAFRYVVSEYFNE